MEMADPNTYVEIPVTTQDIPLLSKLNPSTPVFSDVRTNKMAGPKLKYVENVMPSSDGIKSVEPVVFAENVLILHDRTNWNTMYTVEDNTAYVGYTLADTPEVIRYKSKEGGSGLLNISQYKLVVPNSGWPYNKVRIIADFITSGGARVVDHTINVNGVTPILPMHAPLAKNVTVELTAFRDRLSWDSDLQYNKISVTYIDVANITYVMVSFTYNAARDNTTKTDSIIRQTEFFYIESSSVGGNPQQQAYYYDLPTTKSLTLPYTGVRTQTDSTRHNDVIKGIVHSNGYNIVYSDTTVYWDSPTTPFNFTPSLVTGAGSGIPANGVGVIVGAEATSYGFILYYTQGIVIANYTDNGLQPFSFKPAVTNIGVSDYKKVSKGISTALAITGSGILNITQNGVATIAPKLTEYLAASVYEKYNKVTDDIDIYALLAPLDTKLVLVGNRYLCISTRHDNSLMYYTDILIYDIDLDAYGKVSVDHYSLFEIPFNLFGVPVTPDMVVNSVIIDRFTYAFLSAPWFSYEMLPNIATKFLTSNNLSKAADILYTIGIHRVDGCLAVLDPAMTSTGENSVAVFGDISVKESVITEVDSVSVTQYDNADAGATVVKLATSYKGGDTFNKITILVPVEQDGSYTNYKCRVVGKRHQLALIGSFTLSKVTIGIKSGGYR